MLQTGLWLVRLTPNTAAYDRKAQMSLCTGHTVQDGKTGTHRVADNNNNYGLPVGEANS